MRARFRPSHGTVVAYLALFVALGGTAVATSYVVSSNSQIGPSTISGHNPPAGKHTNVIAGSLNATDLASGAVTNPKLGANAVTAAKVAPNSLTGANILESTLSTVPSASDSAQLGGALPSSYQARVAQSCSGANAIQSIDASGGVSCQPTGTGTITSVSAGTGLSGGGTSGDVTLNVDPTQVQSRLSPGSCSAGEAMQSVAESGAVTCVNSVSSATHATSADSATNADALGGQAPVDFGSGIVGGAATGTFSGTKSFFPVGLTGGSAAVGFVFPVNATVRDIYVSLSSPAPSPSLSVTFTNSTAGASRTCTINSGDTTCDSFLNVGNFSVFSVGDKLTTSANSGSSYSGVISFSYRLTS